MFNKTYAIIAQYLNNIWHEIPVEIEILADTSSYTGDRQIQIKISDEFFQGDTLDHTYKPQKNDILMFGKFSNEDRELRWTKSIISYLFDDSTVQPVPLFLTAWTDDNILTFKPIVCLDEEYWTDYGITYPGLDLILGMYEVWNRLTQGEPHLKQMRTPMDTDINIRPMNPDVGVNDSNGPKKLSDAWKNWVSTLGENVELSLTYSDTGSILWTLASIRLGSSNNNYPYYILDLREYEVSDYTERSRNTAETPNIFKVYTEEKDANDPSFPKTNWIVRNGSPILLEDTITRGSRSPITKYISRESNQETTRDADTRKVLASSFVDDQYVDHDYSMSINIGTSWNWFGRTNIVSGSKVDPDLIPYLNSWIRLTPDGTNIIRGKVREYDLLNGIMLVGTNNDYTFEGGNH